MWKDHPSNFIVVVFIATAEENDTPEGVEEDHAEGHGCACDKEVLSAISEA